MRERAVAQSMETGQLAVHIVSEGGANDHVLILGREPGGVRVREWHPGNWSTGPDESVITPDALLERLEGIVRKRQRVDPDVRTVRAWLTAPR
ncbi:MAG TPA: hypothetical protein VIB98_09030 [Gemmatimonadaceae bacterium]|jgi:hypothetical protein